MSYDQMKIAAARQSLANNKPSGPSGFAGYLARKEIEARKVRQDYQAMRVIMFAEMLMDGYAIPDSMKPSVDAYLASQQQPKPKPKK